MKYTRRGKREDGNRQGVEFGCEVTQIKAWTYTIYNHCLAWTVGISLLKTLFEMYI